jgi:sporadic carbohydrate cluster protein (TIGR04323 family)
MKRAIEATEMAGFRGYVHSRPFLGERAPQHVQNIVIRDYCRRNGLEFLLSAVEYTQAESYLMLNALLKELGGLGGIVAYSMFQLPSFTEERQAVYHAVLEQGKELHFALENLRVAKTSNVPRIEDIWKVRLVLPRCPALPWAASTP